MPEEPTRKAPRDSPPDPICSERLQQLHAALPVTQAISTCVAVILVAVHWPVVPPPILAAWLGAHILVSGARLLLARRFPAREPTTSAVRRWTRYAILGALCAGTVWGAAGILLLQYHDPVRQAFLVMVVAGLSAGAVINLGTIRRAAHAFLIAALAPLALHLIVIDTPLSAPLAAMTALFLLGMSYMAHRIGQQSTDNIRLRSQVQTQRDDIEHQARRYRALVESTSAILWEGDPETFRFTFVSNEAESLLGYPVRRWVEDPTFWFDHMHPDDAAWVPEYYARTTAERRQHTLDYRIIAADGRTVWLRDAVTVLVEDGRPVKLVGVMIDITENKNAELKLRQQEEHYRTLVESTSAIFWEEDPETLCFTFVSQEAENVLGYPVNRWLGNRQFWLDHIHPDDRAEVPAKYENDFRNLNRSAYDYRMIAADGRVVWLRDVATVLMQDDHPYKNVGVMFDITETKEAEFAVEYLSGLQRTLVEVSRQFLVAGPERSNEVIDDALGRVGAHCRVDRAYLFRFREGMKRMDNTHEWTAEGIPPEIDNLQGLSREAVPNVVAVMEQQQIMHVPRVAELGPDWAREREEFEKEDIRSLVVVPVVAGEVVQGFLGFDSVRSERTWGEAEIRLLQVLGDLVGATIMRGEVEHALNESEALRSHAEALAHLGSWEWDVARDVFTASDEWRRVTGCHEHNLSRERVLKIAHPDDLYAVQRALTRTLERCRPLEIEHRIVREDDGEIRWIRVHAELTTMNEGTARLYGFIQDITDRKLAEEAVAESEARYRSVVDSITEVVYRTDENGAYTFLNPAWEEITGYSINDTLGTHFIEYAHPDDRAYNREEYEKLVRGEKDTNRIEVRLLTRDGQIRWLGVDSRVTVDEHNRFTGCTGTLRDVTERHEAEEKMTHLAHYDALTDLPNRMLALDRLEQSIKAAVRADTHVAAVFLDLDHFKKVNDTLGHASGDRVLIEAARRLDSSVRSQDTVARLGGDEFLVILGELDDSTHAQPVALNLLKRFREPFILDDRELVLTTSIGIAVGPQDGDTASELLRNADTALYQSKNEGRNTFHFFTAAMNREVARRLSIEEQLRGALAREEFEVLYQPVIDLGNRDIIGAEALLRWHNPSLGKIGPAEFIPIAEQTGLINAIGDYVLERALANTARWRRDFDSRVRISVNVSPRQFRDAELAQRISTTLETLDLPGDALEVEITEGVLLSGWTGAGELLANLRERGVGIAMDDFGTGYSSLSYLRQYPFDTLKIDQSFIRDITEDPSDRELVVTSLRLAQALGLTTVAEGVETEEQLAVLLDHGCELAQGYLFGRAMDESRFTRLLEGTGTGPTATGSGS